LQVASQDSQLNSHEQLSISQCDLAYEEAIQNRAETLDEIDSNVGTVTAIDQQAKQLVSKLESKLAIEAEERKYRHFYEEFSVATLLFIGGALLFPLNAAGGSALIVEGVKGIRGAVSDLTESNEFVVVTPIKSIALIEFEKINQKIRELFIESWIQLTDQHLQAQKKSIAIMKKVLSPENPHGESLQLLEETYAEKCNEINKIKKEGLLEKKFELINQLANAVQETDGRAKTLMHEVRENLPASAKSESDEFLNRAQRFYENNQKMIRFAGLMAMTAVGIAVTIATGGVAAAIGAAILGAVAFKPIKSFGAHATHFLAACFSEKKSEKPSVEKEKALVEQLKAHAIEHCDEQNKLLDSLDAKQGSVSLIASHAVMPKYEIFSEQLKKAKSIDEVKEISLQIEKQDRKIVGQIQDKNVVQQFKQNTTRFKKENKELFSLVGKVVLAAAALTVVGIATGGVGVGVALGFAAASWLVGKVIKKVRDSLGDKPRIEKKSDESEGESGSVAPK
jgi:hypothetical protein